MAPKITIIPQREFHRVREAIADKYERLSLVADMCRVNTLAIVKRAGSGHLGSSFSAMDIAVWLYSEELNTLPAGLDSPDRDIYFSSKGHDVPGLYSVLYSHGVLPEEKFVRLRRLGGLDGHPDVGVRGIEVNSGSLGMGISKGKGMALAKRLRGNSGRVFVMTGDGELQEGQNYEALQTSAHQRLGNLTIIVDHNKVQSDKPVNEITDLGELEYKLRCFGWHVARCSGHDLRQLERVLSEFRSVSDRPKALIADTVKGRGVSFMEHPAALLAGHGLYPWHSGAPNDESYLAAYAELLSRIEGKLGALGLGQLQMKELEPEDKSTVGVVPAQSLAGEPVSQAAQTWSTRGVSDEYVAKAYGEALVEIGAKRKDIVVLDADLAADCRIRGFEATYPDRFIENGIAEQDMVSTAGGLARQGLLPIVNSFASFLASRANEQIYSNASEKTKIIYVCHYAGLIPAGPGKSHQSIRDISLFGALPNVVILQPCNAAETRMAVEYCIDGTTESCMLRLIIGPSPRRISLPEGYTLAEGRGVALSDGGDAVMMAYGPVMLHEALLASEILAKRGFGLQVVDMPWLNMVDDSWLAELLRDFRSVYVLEDHAPVGGLGDHLLSTMASKNLTWGRRVIKLAVEGYPACGTPTEVLKYHGLDGASLAERVWQSRNPDEAS